MDQKLVRDDWREAMETAVRRLSEAPEFHGDLMRFVDYWGLEFYTPPPEVEETVRNIVAGLLACARAYREEHCDGH